MPVAWQIQNKETEGAGRKRQKSETLRFDPWRLTDEPSAFSPFTAYSERKYYCKSHSHRHVIHIVYDMIHSSDHGLSTSSGSHVFQMHQIWNHLFSCVCLSQNVISQEHLGGISSNIHFNSGINWLDIGVQSQCDLTKQFFWTWLKNSYADCEKWSHKCLKGKNYEVIEKGQNSTPVWHHDTFAKTLFSPLFNSYPQSEIYIDS